MNVATLELDFDTTMMWVSLADGRKLGVPLAYFPRLLGATSEMNLLAVWLVHAYASYSSLIAGNVHLLQR